MQYVLESRVARQFHQTTKRFNTSNNVMLLTLSNFSWAAVCLFIKAKKICILSTALLQSRSEVPFFKSPIRLDPGKKIPTAEAEIEPRICRSRGGHLNHKASEAAWTSGKTSAWTTGDLEVNPCFPLLSLSIESKIGHLVATLPGVQRHHDNAGTGWPGVSQM